MAEGMSDPELPLDPIEALLHIRTILEASADMAFETEAEPLVREIMSILDEALPPHRRRSPTKQ